MATNEALVLDGLAINDAATFMILDGTLTMNPPAAKPEWISGADSDGAILSREPKYENRIIECRIAVLPQATKNLALQKIALVLDKFKEAERQANGLALTWVPANSTLPTVTFRCLSGEITELPISMASGWMGETPEFMVRMTCLPFGEGTESQVATVTSSAPIIVLPDVTALAGDVPALGRLVVLDAASKDRRYVMWGLESRYYPTSSAPSLIVDSSGMVTTGFTGVTGTRTGAYSGATNNVIDTTLRSQLQAVCGLGNLSHVGQFRPQLRFYAGGTDMAVRLTYKVNDGPLRSLSFKIPTVVGWNHVDLGLVTIPEAVAGTQRWTGQIEAFGTTGTATIFDVDAVWMMPAELFGRARAVYAYKPGALSAFDDFNGITAGTALNARVALLGGTWATSGVATDFAAADAPLATDETESRTTILDASPRFAVLGATNYTNTEVGVSFYNANLKYPRNSVIARWVDANNYAELFIYPFGGQFELRVTVAGVVTTLKAATGVTAQASTQYQLRIAAYTSGRIVGWLLDSSGGILASLSAQSSVLATGGALATGKPGFSDQALVTGSFARYYDNFYAAVPAPEPIVCYSTQTIEFRHNATVREDSTGVYYGDPPEYVGARFKIPNAGGPAREARIAVIARRNDVESAADDDLTANATTDSTTVTVFATPRFLAVPR
jgi:hypothetical protein